MILYRKYTVSLASSPSQLSGGQHADWLDQTKAQPRGTRPQGRARDTAGPEGGPLAGSQETQGLEKTSDLVKAFCTFSELEAPASGVLSHSTVVQRHIPATTWREAS